MSEQLFISGTEPKTNKAVEALRRAWTEAKLEARSKASHARGLHETMMQKMLDEGVEVHVYYDAMGKKKMLRAKVRRTASITTEKTPRASKRGRRGSSWSESSTAANSHAGAPPAVNGTHAKLAEQAEASVAPNKKRKAKR